MRGRPSGSKDKNVRTRGWSCADLKFLRENYSEKSLSVLSKYLNKSISNIRKTAEECKLKKKGIPGIYRFLFDDFINSYENVMGVYCIVNNDNNKAYIGSSEDMGSRVNKHRQQLRKNSHDNKLLQKDWNEDRFSVGILYEGIDYQNKEQEYINNIIASKVYNTCKYLSIPILSLEDQTRFWNKISIKDINDCWEWNGKKRKDGYGAFDKNKISYSAHRIAYYLTYNIDPNGMCIMHRCNNKRCCNPFHLDIGTHAENTRNAHRDGLYHYGKI